MLGQFRSGSEIAYWAGMAMYLCIAGFGVALCPLVALPMELLTVSVFYFFFGVYLAAHCEPIGKGDESLDTQYHLWCQLLVLFPPGDFRAAFGKRRP